MRQPIVHIFTSETWPGKTWFTTLQKDSLLFDKNTMKLHPIHDQELKQGDLFGILNKVRDKEEGDSLFVILCHNQPNLKLSPWLEKESDTLLILAAKESERNTLPQSQSISIVDESIHSADLILIVKKAILLMIYAKDIDRRKTTEIEWLIRVEHLLSLSSKEIYDAEATGFAYEQLAKYEQHLLSQHKKVNLALLNLQDYRDEIERDWLKEKEARETAQNMMSNEMRDLSDTMKAQENLLKYAEEEQKAFRQIMSLFIEKGSIESAELQKILSGHEMLQRALERLKK